ncbi:MAG: NADH-quinone oxidoreductase subunit N [Pirellulaceae bacterium]
MLPNLATVSSLLPEIILITAAVWLFCVGTWLRSRAWWALFAPLGVLVAMAALYFRTPQAWFEAQPIAVYYQGPLVIDSLSLAGRWIGACAGLLFVLIGGGRAPRQLSSEYLGTMILAAVGVMIVSSANDLVLFFLGLELISIPTYALLYLGQRDRGTSEATVKYFFLSILSSAMLLYGLSFVYGMGGTTVIAGGEGVASLRAAFDGLANTDEAHGLAQLAPIAFVLLLAGLGFKMAAVPFHFYAPDVYQGATNANAGVLAVLPKIAGVIGLVRLATLLAPLVGDFAWQSVMVISLLTMTIGNVCALWQKSFRRLMAYSSIAHAGYMLIGLSVALASPQGALGLTAMLFYLLVYAFASLGSFAAAAWLSGEQRELDAIDELKGVGRTHPQAAGPLAVFMFSLAGIPPLAGFWGKFSLFGSAVQIARTTDSQSVQMWFVVLAVVGALNAAIAAAYYLRIVASLYFQPHAARAPARGGIGALAATALCTIVVVLVGISPGGAFGIAEQAGETAASVAGADQAAEVQNIAAADDR